MDDTRRRRDRGQILLISGLLLAVLFVGLAVVVNSAVYAENRATRGATSSASALAEEPVTEDRITESMARANYHSDTDSFTERRDDIVSNITTWRDGQRNRGAADGKYLSSEVIAATNGTRISQETDDDFTPAGDDLTNGLLGTSLDPLGLVYGDRMSWVVAPDVQSRAFQATVERSSLKQIGDSYNLLELVDYILTGGNDPFGVVFSEDASHNAVYLLNPTGGGSADEVAAVITAGNDSGEEVQGVCRIEGETVTVKPGANELVSGDDTTTCPELSFTEDLGRHNVTFVGSDNVKGTYRFIVDKDEETLHDDLGGLYDSSLLGDLLGSLTCGGFLQPECDDTILEKHPSDGYPFTTQAVYSASVNQTYMTDRVTYQQTSTYAPAAK